MPQRLPEMPMDSGPQIGDSPTKVAAHEGGPYPSDPQNVEYDAEQAGYYPWDGQPAPIESSGTWLNRGVWYAEVRRCRSLPHLAAAGRLVGGRRCRTSIIPNIPRPSGIQLTTNRAIFLQAAQPGEDAGVRATLGRFLFRDDQNRDHTLEFTAWAAGNWVSDGIQLASAQPNGLFVTFERRRRKPTFDRSSLQR